MSQYLLKRIALFLLIVGIPVWTGCATVVGYGIGSSVDSSNESLEYVDHAYAHTIKAKARVLILMKDGREFEATFLDSDPGTSILVQRIGREKLEGPLWVMLDDIKSIMVIHRPDEGRHKYTAIGATVDLMMIVVAYGFYLFAEAFSAVGATA
ncbi:hypothetical protein KQI63_04515 [bacterium]|nr:hypothetical protein [bacterium]